MQYVKDRWRSITVLSIAALLVAGGLSYAFAGTGAGAFPVNAKDTIASWTFTGAYTGNETLEAQAAADVEKLKALLGKGEYDDYDLYIGLGNDANLVGDGRGAYRAYLQAIAIHPEKGLAYANLAHLFDELGASSTAADAYAKAVAVESTSLTYHTERLNYLVRRFPEDDELIRAALADASEQFGDTPAVLAIEAEWLEDRGRYADAVKAWQAVKLLSPADRHAAIEAQIARDEAKAPANAQ